MIFAVYASSSIGDLASIEGQIAAGRQYAAAHSASTIDYVDNGVDGTTIGPRLRQLLEDAKLGVFRRLVVDHQSRLARTPAVLIRVIFMLYSEDVRCLILDGNGTRPTIHRSEAIYGYRPSSPSPCKSNK